MSQEESITVTREDQQNINLFGRLNNKFHQLEGQIRDRKVPHLPLPVTWSGRGRVQGRV